MQQAPVIIENLSVKYGPKTVLDNISASFAGQQIRVILGTSGCGKTTLLKSIIGLITPHAGTIRLFGRVMDEFDTEESQRVLCQIGVLFQNGALLGSLTVGENIALPLQLHTSLSPALIAEIVQLKLTQVNLPGAAPLFPNELSGGMRKRAALARALALDPPLLFCDEPSAGLDPVTSAGLDELLLQLRENLGITIVVVTHELQSIEKIADQIIFLHNGSILYDGLLRDATAIAEGPVADFFRRTERRTDEGGRSRLDFSVEIRS
jgi:phospholipid/cholesterol/gamma-HCH transport system ATP-binding protein